MSPTTVKLPFPVTDSNGLTVDVARTVNEDVPLGVRQVVLIVRVEVLLKSEVLKVTGAGEKENVAPEGRVVVIVRFALKAPDEPPPVPRFTVTVKVVEPAAFKVSDWVPTTTLPT